MLSVRAIRALYAQSCKYALCHNIPVLRCSRQQAIRLSMRSFSTTLSNEENSTINVNDKSALDKQLAKIALKKLMFQKRMNSFYLDCISKGDIAVFNNGFDKNFKSLSMININTILFQFAKLRMSKNNDKEIKSNSEYCLDSNRLRCIIDLLEKHKPTDVDSTSPFKITSPQGLGNLLYSFVGIEGGHPARDRYIELLESLSDYVKYYSGDALTPRAISNAVYGLQSFSNVSNGTIMEDREAAVVRKVLKYLTRLIANNSDKNSCESTNTTSSAFSGQDVGMFLYGLRNMKCTGSVAEGNEVSELLEAFGDRLLAVSNLDGVSFSAQAISNSLYGMHNFDSKVMAVRKVLHALAPQIHASVEAFNPQNVGNSLYGLQNMSSTATLRLTSDSGEVPESEYPNAVDEVIVALTSKIAKCSEPLNAQHLGNALYGLQNLSSNSIVRGLLSALIPLLNSCEEAVKPHHIDNALYGLKNMSCEHREVRRILELLSIKIQSCSDTWLSTNIARAVYGLQNMNSNTTEVKDILDSLALEMSTCIASGSYFSSQSIGNILYGIQNMQATQKEVKEFISTFCDALDDNQKYFASRSHRGSSGAVDYDMESNHYFEDELDRKARLVGRASMPTSIMEQLYPITSQNIGSAIYGLQKKSCIDNLEMKRLVDCLTNWIEDGIADAGGISLDQQAVSNILYGLHKMPVNTPEVDRLFRVLLGAMERDSTGRETLEGFSDQDVGVAFYALQNMSMDAGSSDIVSVLLREMFLRLTAYAPIAHDDHVAYDVNRIPQLSIASLSCGFYGLRNFSFDPSASLENDILYKIVSIFAYQLSTSGTISSQAITPLALTNILYGLQSLVTPLVATVDRKSFAGKREVILSIFKTLSERLPCAVSGPNSEVRVATMSLLQASQCINGLLELSNEYLNADTSRILTFLLDSVESHISKIEQTTPGQSRLNIPYSVITSMYQMLSLCTVNIATLDSVEPDTSRRIGELHERMHAILYDWKSSELSLEYQLAGISVAHASGSVNTNERAWISSVKRVFATYPDVSILSNVYLRGFESDVLVIIPASQNKPAVVINVELDGPHHVYFPSKQRFTRLRDAYIEGLSGSGVLYHIVRIPFAKLESKSKTISPMPLCSEDANSSNINESSNISVSRGGAGRMTRRSRKSSGLHSVYNKNNDAYRRGVILDSIAPIVELYA